MTKRYKSVARCVRRWSLLFWMIDNADASNRVLWDWRRFLADQLSENHFAEVARLAEEHGLTYVGESTGRQQYLYDIAYLRDGSLRHIVYSSGRSAGWGSPAASTYETYGRRAQSGAKEIDWERFKAVRPEPYRRIAEQVEATGVTWEQAVSDREIRITICKATGYWY